MKNTVFKNVASYDSYVTIGGAVHSSSTDLVSWKIENVADTFLGSFPCGKVEIEIHTERLKDYVGKEIKVYLRDRTTLQYTLMGTYVVDKNSFDDMQKSQKITGFDVALKFNRPMDITLKVPGEGKNLVREITTLCDVEISEGAELDFNPRIIEKVNYDINTSARQLIAEYAQINGCSACINSEGLLVFKKIEANSSVVDTIEKKHYSEIEIGKTEEPINTVVISNTAAEDNVVVKSEDSGNTKEFKLKDNSWIYFNREAVKDYVANHFKGITYTPFKVDVWDFAHLDMFDKIHFKSTQDEVFTGYIQNITYEFNGGLVTKISSKQLPQTKTNYALAKPNPILKKTLLELDKVKGELRLNITEVKDRIKSVEQTTTPEKIETIITEKTNSKLNELLAEKIKEIYEHVDDELELKKEAILTQVAEPDDKTKAWLNPITGEFKVYTTDKWQLVNDPQQVERILRQQLTLLEGKVSSKEELALLASDFLKLGNDWETYKKILSGDYDKFKESQGQFRSDLDTLKTTITQDTQGLLIKNNQGNLSVRLGNSRLSFLDNGVEVAYVSNQRLFINSGVFLSSLTIGNYKISKSEDGKMLFFDYIGGDY